MKIRPKISKFQQGGVPLWYLNLYNQHALNGWNNTLRYDYANQNLNSNDHYNAGNLETVYRKQNVYTNTPNVVALDIQSFYNTDGGNMTAEEFVNFYNLNAEKIRNHWASDLTYNASSAGDHNRLFRKMFLNRSNTSSDRGSDYNIGYQEGITKGGYDILDIEGSSTWLRRMDRYENEFDPNNPDLNRIHEITLKDGTKAKVYKKANGDIGLLSTGPGNPLDPNNPEPLQDPNLLGKVPVQHGQYNKLDLSKLSQTLRKAFPDLLGIGRLAGTLAFNDKIFNTKLKGVRPNLQQTYLTHRQVLGDEATKQAYYKRAAAGQTRANRAMTSDKDKNMAYMYEAKRIGDELREKGDLADNAEIRRTSDESNQHQWANTQRRTEVANRNIIELNNANAAKQDLKAQKYAADWTSINNYLMGKEHELKLDKAELKALLDLIWALDEQNKLQTDPEYLKLYEAYSKAYDEAKGNLNDPKLKAAKEQLRIKQYQMKRRLLESMIAHRNRNIFFGKDGLKITRKRKDDLLYKTSRDAVEHFRKMTKLMDDSTHRSRTKPIKLSSHPGAPRRMQQGGVAPFQIYTPVTLGGETTTSSQGSDLLGTKSGSGKGSGKGEKSTFDIIKELFKDIKGLPSDVNGLFSSLSSFLAKEQAFGNELDPEDLQIMFLLQMNQLNNIKFSREAYDKAKEEATKNEALNEFAVDNAGRVAVLDKDGKLSFVSWSKVKEGEGLNPLTNNDLLNLRAYSTDMTFNDGIFNVVNNGVGITKIAEFIKSHTPNMGSSEQTLEGFTKHETEQIKKGFELLKEAPTGDYKYSQYTKEQLKLAEMALNYIASILPRNMKSILNIHADLEGTSVSNILTSLISSRMDISTKMEFDPVTGKAASKNGGGSGKDASDVKSNPLISMQRGIGGTPMRYDLVTKDSNTRMSVNGTFYSALPKIDEDMSIDRMLSTSGIDGIITSKRGITFGDLQVNPEDLRHIMYSNNGGIVVTLPCKVVNGVKLVNLDVREAYERAEQKASLKFPDRNSNEYAEALGKELEKEGLSSLLNEKGLPNKSMFALFLVVEGYTSDRINLKKDSQYIEKVNNPSEDLEKRMSTALSTDKKKSDYSIDVKDTLSIFEWGYDDVFRGTIFIPLSNNINSAIDSWDKNEAELGLTQELELLYLNFNKSTNFNSNNSFEE